MLARMSPLRVAPRRDVLIYAVGVIALLAFTVLWALFIAPITIPFLGQKLFLWIIVLGFSALVAVASWIGGGRSAPRPIARLMVRLGLAMEILALTITPIGLFYATNPIVSVPVGFAAFLTMFFGVFIAGFGGNMIAPPRA